MNGCTRYKFFIWIHGYVFSVAPDAPGKPEVTDYDKDHVDLKWAPPLSDGGAPVEKYLIEKKGKDGIWMPAAEVPGDQTTGTVTNLLDGQTYEFRVKAVNKAGPGKRIPFAIRLTFSKIYIPFSTTEIYDWKIPSEKLALIYERRKLLKRTVKKAQYCHFE